jgi:hypothetical protein
MTKIKGKNFVILPFKSGYIHGRAIRVFLFLFYFFIPEDLDTWCTDESGEMPGIRDGRMHPRKERGG